MRQVRRDPAPSRLAYRLHRLWLRPLVRAAVRVGLPLLVIGALATAWLADAGRREVLAAHLAAVRAAVAGLPQLQVTDIRVAGAPSALEARIRETLGPVLPASALELDLPALRARVVALAEVRSAEMRVDGEGRLDVRVAARRPVVLWRGPAGLMLLDGEGTAYAAAGARGDHPALPVLAGRGVPGALDEARRLLAAAAPLAGRLRGLERIGGRRWDAVLTDGQRIMLPEAAPAAALSRVIALDEAPGVRLLSRDVRLIDMRLAERPTLRLSPRAAGRLRERIRDRISRGAGEG